MDQRAIGVFDSGLGGLTTVRELRRLLPEEHIIYFGDTGRVPYGSRGREIIRKYAVQDIRFLRRFDVKIIIAACGTVSSVITPEIVESAGVPFSGVVLPAAQAVPLVENGFIQPDNEITIKVAQTYLQPMIENEVDTLILGCTHYPLIRPVIDRLLQSRVTLIDSGAQVARWAQTLLTREDMLGAGNGGAEYYVSDSPEMFIETAGIFLGEDVHGNVTQIDLDTL